MKTCYGYVRVSTLKQGEGVSLEAQKQAILRFTQSNEIEIVRWFEEKVTAAKSGRPEFNSMLRLLRKGRAAGVVMHKIDRSARNFRDWATIGELADAGIDVHFATESLDFRSRGGRLSADIQAVIAADYIRNLKEEVCKGINGRLQQGLYPFGAPIGYLNNGGGRLKTPDPVKAPFIRQAFELYASGKFPLRALHQKMKKLGLTNRNGNPVSRSLLAHILNNPFYAGIIRIKRSGQTYPGKHEPLISMQLFESVQAVKAGKTVIRTTHRNHTYRGLFRCAECNRSMVGESQKGHVYYRCHQRGCGNCIREEVMEEATVAMLDSIRLSDEDIATITARFRQWLTVDEQTGRQQALALQMNKLDARIDRLTDALIDRLIDEDEFNRRKAALLQEQSALVERMEAADTTKLDPAIVTQTLERLKTLAEHYKFADSADKREILEIASSNRSVSRKKIELELSNWLRTAQNLMAVQSGPDTRTTVRTDLAQNKGPNCDNRYSVVSDLHQLVTAPETRRLEKLVTTPDCSPLTNQL